MHGEKNHVHKLDKIPEGSGLEKYLNEIPQAMKGDYDTILSFFKKTFSECLEFVKQKLDQKHHPEITLRMCHTHEQYKAEVKNESKKNVVSKETAKYSSLDRAVHVGNLQKARIYVDLEFYIEMLQHGYPTLIFDLVQTYIHEILHTFFPEKSEQEIHDLQCYLVESFLGIELPKSVWNLKASDYYTKKET